MNAPAGAVVAALCPSPSAASPTVCGETTVWANGTYNLFVYGNDSSAGSEYYAESGQQIALTINGYAATVTGNASWTSLAHTWANLATNENEVTQAMGTLAGAYHEVQGYTAGPGGGATSFYTNPQDAAGNNLASLQPLQGYWLNLTRGGTFTISGLEQPGATVTLQSGWNLVGWDGTRRCP